MVEPQHYQQALVVLKQHSQYLDLYIGQLLIIAVLRLQFEQALLDRLQHNRACLSGVENMGSVICCFFAIWETTVSDNFPQMAWFIVTIRAQSKTTSGQKARPDGVETHTPVLVP